MATFACQGCSWAMPVAADRCPSCGRENEIVATYREVAESVARSHGFASFAEAEAASTMLGPILARQVRWGALGLSLSFAALMGLFSQGEIEGGVGAYAGAIAVFGCVAFAVFWLLLGGRSTSNPFATVRAIQLWSRRVGGWLWLPAAIVIAIEVAYFAANGSTIFVTDQGAATEGMTIAVVIGPARAAWFDHGKPVGGGAVAL